MCRPTDFPPYDPARSDVWPESIARLAPAALCEPGCPAPLGGDHDHDLPECEHCALPHDPAEPCDPVALIEVDALAYEREMDRRENERRDEARLEARHG